MRHSRKFSLGFYLTIASALVVGGPALAGGAPQLLGLVAVNNPIDFQCRGGECFAEFSAFCLQSEKRAPAPGMPYLRAVGDIQLIGKTNDGQTVHLNPDKHLSFTAHRTHVSVRMSTPVKLMYDLGLKTLSVSVGKNVSLKPDIDPKVEPQSVAEMDLATGTLRQVGTRIIDNNKQQMSAAHITNRIANRLPPRGRIHESVKKAAFDHVIKNYGGPALMPGPAGRLIKRTFDRCYETSHYGGYHTFRQCLSGLHDGFMGRLNKKYWDAVKTGS